ncbi:MAG TPA: hypothetical protein VNK82_02870 [Terriglobales bacterium]|nr:hypothetical protein [Terriglobales bacterium]
MKNAALFLAVLVLALPASAAAETWENVTVVDTMCSAKVKAAPDEHTTKCALACAQSGFGILTADGSFLKLDAAGNQKVVDALKSTKKTDHLRATITGERQGGNLKVQSLNLQ